MSEEGQGRWRAAAVLALLAWLLLLGSAVVVTARAGYAGISLQSSSFQPVTLGGESLPVVAVVPGGPAEQAGVRRGDLLLAVDGVPVGDPGRFAGALLASRSGTISTLRLRRSGEVGANDVPVALVSALARPGALTTIITYGAAGGLGLLISAAVVLMRPADQAARIFLALGAAGAFWQAMDAHYGGMRERLLPLGWDPVDQVGYLGALLQVVTLVHFSLVFPAPLGLWERLRSLGPPLLRRLGGGVLLLYLVPPLVAGVPFVAHQSVVQPLLLMAAAGALLALALLTYSYLRPASVLARAQLRWVLCAAAVVVAGVIGGPLLESLTDRPLPSLSWTTAVAIWALTYLALGLALLRYRLQDTATMLRAALLYPLLAAMLVGSYVGASFLISTLLAPFFPHGGPPDPAVQVLLAIAVAAAMLPLRQRLLGVLDTVLNRDQRAMQRFAREAAATLDRAQPPEVVAEVLTAQAVERLHVNGAWLVHEAGIARAGEAAASGPEEWAGEALRQRLAGEDGLLVLSTEPLPGFPARLLRPNDALLAAWYRAGARLLLPLNAHTEPQIGAGTPLPAGVWALGLRRSLELPGRVDLEAVQRLGQKAAVLLEYARMARAHLAAQRQLFEERMLRHASQDQAAQDPGFPLTR